MAEVLTSNQGQSGNTGLTAIVAAVAETLGIDLSSDGAMAQVRPIFPTAVYDEDTASTVTGTSASTRFRAVRSGKLKCRRIGSRRLYLGSDLLNWIAGRKGEENQ